MDDVMRASVSGDHLGRVLVVCTANVSRSPYIEKVLASRVPGLRVSSAGTEAEPGEPIDPWVAERLRASGIAPGDFVSRQLTPELIADADLVLTAVRQHRAEVAKLWPRALGYSFQLGDFAQGCAGLDPADLTGVGLPAFVARMAERRGMIAPLPAADVDIPDPVGGPVELHTKIAVLVDTFVDVIAPILLDVSGAAGDLRR